MRPKTILVLAAICSIPSFLDYTRGYLDLSSLLLRVIIAMVFALLASQLIGRLVEWARIEERRVRRRRTDEA